MQMLAEIQVFKTTVSKNHIDDLKPLLDKLLGRDCWNFALDDCDRILRMEADKASALRVAMLLHGRGFVCEELED